MTTVFLTEATGGTAWKPETAIKAMTMASRHSNVNSRETNEDSSRQSGPWRRKTILANYIVISLAFAMYLIG